MRESVIEFPPPVYLAEGTRYICSRSLCRNSPVGSSRRPFVLVYLPLLHHRPASTSKCLYARTGRHRTARGPIRSYDP